MTGPPGRPLPTKGKLGWRCQIDHPFDSHRHLLNFFLYTKRHIFELYPLKDLCSVCAGTSEHQYTQSRVGPALPVCCPWHPESQKWIERPADFPWARTWGGFCTLPCKHSLDWCGHACSAPCHACDATAHTSPSCCPQLVQHPCPHHSTTQLTCGQVYAARPRGAVIWRGGGCHLDLVVGLRRWMCC